MRACAASSSAKEGAAFATGCAAIGIGRPAPTASPSAAASDNARRRVPLMERRFAFAAIDFNVCTLPDAILPPVIVAWMLAYVAAGAFVGFFAGLLGIGGGMTL